MRTFTIHLLNCVTIMLTISRLPTMLKIYQHHDLSKRCATSTFKAAARLGLCSSLLIIGLLL